MADHLGPADVSGIMNLFKMGEEAAATNAPNLSGKSQLQPKMGVSVKTKAQKKAEEEKKKEEKHAIWNENDFQKNSGVVVKEAGDDRPEPQHEVKFLQRVGTNDVFLNLGDRDTSSDHCEEIVVKVWLPNTKLKQITLDVLKDRIMLQAPKYRLNLPLPHPVKKDDGNAKWDAMKGLLSVELPIDREVRYFTSMTDAVDKLKDTA